MTRSCALRPRGLRNPDEDETTGSTTQERDLMPDVTLRTIKINILVLTALVLTVSFNQLSAQDIQARNPIIFADVPDMAMIRVGDVYYMSSTTMHMSPGVPIMKSKDLINWRLVNYSYDTLANIDALNLDNGKSTYGRGSWASSIRYHNGTYFRNHICSDNRQDTHIFTTKDIENGPWKETSFKPSYHDHTLFFR